MSKKCKELSALEVGLGINEIGYHHVGGVAGLVFRLRTGSKSWLCASLSASVIEIGLGGFSR